jgi:hypothetical protein
MMLALYRTKYRSRKWYQQIALHLISRCAVNAWIIYREMGGLNSYLDFLTEICVTLMAGTPQSIDSDEEQPEPPPPKKRMKASSRGGSRIFRTSVKICLADVALSAMWAWSRLGVVDSRHEGGGSGR